MLTAIRQDIRAAKERDPANPTTLQVVVAYPGVHAVWGHRISHSLWNRGAKVAARGFAELTRILTGVEIQKGGGLVELHLQSVDDVFQTYSRGHSFERPS